MLPGRCGLRRVRSECPTYDSGPLLENDRRWALAGIGLRVHHDPSLQVSKWNSHDAALLDAEVRTLSSRYLDRHQLLERALVNEADGVPVKFFAVSSLGQAPVMRQIASHGNVEQALERDRVGERRYWDPFEAGDRAEARFVVDACQVENGALKMRMWNTAPPMTPEEMGTYFCTIGTSHSSAAQYSSTNRDGQLGQGFRQGTLPWNTYGVVAISIDPLRTDEPAVMMWMHKTPLNGADGPLVYKIRALPAFRDSRGPEICDVVARTCALKGHKKDTRSGEIPRAGSVK